MSAGVYLHIPFCKSRCSYCDFATDVYRDSGAVERYVDAIVREIKGRNPNGSEGVDRAKHPTLQTSPRADTIYFGGGTPSLLNPQQLDHVLNAVRGRFDVVDSVEITMEMNPATVTAETLAAYKNLGVNRGSFGVQTFNDRDLKLLARGHDANDARTTFRMLREAGFDNISFDLIAGLPGQTMADWTANLDEAVRLDPEHISLYLLEIHSGTPLAEQLRRGRRKAIDEELAAEMYEVMLDRLAAAGFLQYEISNFAKPGFESRHNMKYWRLDPVYGFGVSAHSFDGIERYANVRDTAEYVALVENTGMATVMRETTDIASECAFLGLRLENGIDLAEYERRFGINLVQKHEAEINHLHAAGLIYVDAHQMSLTRKGKLYSNEVFAVFV